MQGNVLGSGGTNVNNSLFPIYQQVLEPVVKKGVWIKSTENLKNIYFQEDLLKEEAVVSLNAFSGGTYTYIGIEKSIFAIERQSSFSNNIYKYNLENVEVTTIVSPVRGTIIATNVGTDIYLFVMNGNDSHQLYKFDTISSTFTQLQEDNDYLYRNSSSSQSLSVVETNIYYINDSSKSFKYDTNNNLFTELQPISGTSNYDCTESVDEEIYIFDFERSWPRERLSECI